MQIQPALCEQMRTKADGIAVGEAGGIGLGDGRGRALHACKLSDRVISDLGTPAC